MARNLLSIPNEALPVYDELYVISDLHLGGKPDFQIFNSTAELTGLIEHLRARPAKKTIALLINGDFVDFLAQAPAAYFDPERAAQKLEEITNEKSNFHDIFKALRSFTATPGRFLIINIGNHDLELALPWVRESLLRKLAGDEISRSRVILSFDGTGFRCRVGNAAVLCVHGNEIDAWNVADYESIRRLAREVTQGRPIDEWVPNGGSHLVVDVMNDLKVEFPFIDLLKPETRALYPTLLALAPEMEQMKEMKFKMDKISEFAMSFGYKTFDYLRQMTGMLGADERDFSARAGANVNGLSKSGFRMTIDPTSSAGTDDSPESVLDRQLLAEILLNEAESNFRNNVNPFSIVVEQHDAYLGSSGRYFDKINDLWVTVKDMIRYTAKILNVFSEKEISQRLFEALCGLKQDRSFDPGTPDSTFELLDEQVGTDIDFLIAGHTHLERALKRKKGSGWYFNSGTWTRLIQLDDVLTNAEEFKELYGVLKQGSMPALDAYKNLVQHKLTVIAVREKSGRTHGELLRARLSPATGEVALISPKELDPPEPEYIFTKN